jgi:hypothetical protein
MFVKTIPRCCAILLLIPHVIVGETMTASLRADRTTYRVGDEITFTVTFRNAGSRTVLFLPECWYFPANYLVVSDLQNKKVYRGKHYRSLSMDDEGRARDAKLLSPGKPCNIVIKARVTKSLPPDFKGFDREDREAGLFLVFTGSAKKLAKPGRYNVKAIYDMSSDDPATSYAPKIWIGKITSNTITIDIGK